jgi:peptidyl-prolyl cis-trans isomerase SurA
MKQTQALVSSIVLALILVGCGTSNPVVATIGHDKITLTDFEKSYAKNNGGWSNAVSSSLDDRKRFLDLLVKFQLKVDEAKDRGLLHDSAVTREMDEYRLSVAQSYMLDKEVIEPHVKQMYDRKLEDIRAAHIFFRLPQHPTPADTLAAYEKAEKVIALLPTVNFDTLAREYSQDPQTATIGGDVGWVLPGRLPESFENAVYSLKQGEYSKVPIRSPYGYHVLKVLIREPAKGAIRISHILKRFSRDLKDTTAVRDTVMMIYDELRHGADFAELAKKFSDDPGSAARGGDIGFYERERLRPDIVNLLYELPVDSIPAPYRQPYGYHIFKVTGRNPVAPFAEMEKNLRTEYQQRNYPQDRAQYVQNLEHRYAVTLDSAVFTTLRVAFDTTKTPTSEGWSDTLSSDLLAKTLFTCMGKPFSVRDFVDEVGIGTGYKTMLLTSSNVVSMVGHVMEAQTLKEHALAALDKYPQLKRLMDEYLDGILLYRIDQDEVWKKVVVNDSLLRVFYDSTKQNYRWPERVNFAEIYVLTDSVKNAVLGKLAEGNDFLSVAEEYTARPSYRDKLGIWGLQPYDLNELSSKAAKMPVDSVSAFFRY